MNKTEDRKTMACPLNGKLCVSGQREDFPKNEAGAPHQCRFWIHVYGKNPQSEEILDHSDCAVAYMPTIQIEGNQQTRFVSAEVNEVRKEVRKASHFTRKLATAAFRGARLISEIVNNRIAAKTSEKNGIEHKNGAPF